MVRARRVHVLVKISTALVLVATLWVWQRVTVVKMVHENDRLRANLQTKKELVEKVAAQVSLLRHRARIEQIAVLRLGLGPTRPAQRRVIPRIELPVQKVEDNSWQKLNNSLRKLRTIKVPKSP